MQAEEATQSELSRSWRLLETEGLAGVEAEVEAEVEAGVEEGVVALVESEIEALVEAKFIIVDQLSLAQRLIVGSLA